MDKLWGFAMIVGVVFGIVYAVKDWLRERKKTDVERLKEEWRGW